MKCTTCGAELVPGAAFCANCGTRAPLPASSAGQHTVQLSDPYTPLGSGPAATAQPASPVPWSGGYTPVGSAATSNLAIISMICGLLGIAQILPIIGPLIAIVAGHMARREIRDSGGRTQGSGMALVGLITGYFMLAVYLLFCVIGIVMVFVFTSVLGTMV